MLIANAFRLYILKPFMPETTAEALGHAAGIASLALTSFFLHKFITFAEPALAHDEAICEDAQPKPVCAV